MNRTLFLHVGPAKTGTSAIQAYFKSNQFETIYYPHTGQWPDGSHHKLVFATRNLRYYGPIEIPEWEELKQQLCAEIATTNKDIFISSEVCQPGFIDYLTEITTQFNLQLKVIMVYRDATARASSIYNQNVKDPVVGLALNPDDFLEQQVNQFKIRPLFQRWRKKTNEIHLMSYGSDTPLLASFCKYIGVMVSEDDASKIFNRSMGGHALIAMLIANKVLASENERRAFFEAMRQRVGFRIWSGGSYPFTRQAVEKLKVELQCDRQWAVSYCKELGFNSLAEQIPKPFVLNSTECNKIIALLENQRIYKRNKLLVTEMLEQFS
jgi:hypothetical protein